jgi:NAD(P)-dependent dehydrogenase (short-subunit alcohol dehydrogenase family)
METPASVPLRSRVAVVTGGSAGVGRALVRELAERGWDVGILARGEDGLEAAAAEVRAAGRRALAVPTDVSIAAEVEAAADQVEAELGPIEAWVNNAFAGAICFFDELSPEEYDRITAVTYGGYVNGTRAALARMRPRDRGTVVQVGSALAFRGIPLQAAYCGAKHAIHGFTDSVRSELLHAKSRVRIAEVHLPAVNTPQFDWVLHRGVEHHPQPVPPIYQPEVPARVIAQVLDRPRRQALVGLPTFLTIWADRLAPSLLDRYLARTNVEAQQNEAKDPPGAEANLWDPLPGDHGAHGSFDDSAHRGRPTAWLSAHGGPMHWAGAGAVLAAAGTVVRRARARS